MIFIKIIVCDLTFCRKKIKSCLVLKMHKINQQFKMRWQIQFLYQLGLSVFDNYQNGFTSPIKHFISLKSLVENFGHCWFAKTI